ncbi:RNA polymerase II-binding domain-containing protein [Paraphoma chrysanthemicola]|uniref:RNA polymerase II-binding domain-containing protein n=1 Tax=Paraphoma chrysanthemicola TaxID=798071 RepID=A0A8K0RFQ3_9PLEO|nr:RNA polymerase II-binding domain-containing protein [Paraphoma chrysanthemicola]
MAFTEDSLKAKLSSLNETQEAISTVGQWILFHRRHADRIAQVWLQRMKESSPPKKLVLIYLANEITQTSKMRKKEEFLKAYEPILAEATQTAYKGSPADIQNKIRRVVEVWRQRNIFALPVQQDVEKRLNEIDSSRGPSKKTLGGSLFSSSSVPPELTSVAPLATSLQKADLNTKPAVAAANQDYEKLTNPNNAIPSPPMHAAGLSTLVKKLAVAEGAVAESIKARQALVAGLEKLLETNRTKLEQEEAQVVDLRTRKDAIESRKRKVEEAILKGLSAAETNKISTAAPLPASATSPVSQERPQVEELTPPPMESFTPVGSPQQAAAPGFEPVPDIGDDIMPEPVANPVEPQTAPAPGHHTTEPAYATAIGEPNHPAPEDLLKSLQHSLVDRGHEYGQNAYQQAYKKRKMSRSAAEDEFAAFAGDGDMKGIDDNLGELI